jgi:hypothetical protein
MSIIMNNEYISNEYMLDNEHILGDDLSLLDGFENLENEQLSEHIQECAASIGSFPLAIPKSLGRKVKAVSCRYLIPGMWLNRWVTKDIKMKIPKKRKLVSPDFDVKFPRKISMIETILFPVGISMPAEPIYCPLPSY